MQKTRQTRQPKRILTDEELFSDYVRKRGKEMKEYTIIFGYHQLIDTLNHPVRKEITMECNWSLSKYYRKRKLNSETVSNAEKEKIIEIITRKKDQFDRNFELFIASVKVDKNPKRRW